MEILFGSIDLNKIDPKKINEVTLKNGDKAKYLPISIIINDEPDAYNNIASVTLGQNKEEIEQKAKKTYLGNLKRVWMKSPEPNAQVPLQQTTIADKDDSNLPF